MTIQKNSKQIAAGFQKAGFIIAFDALESHTKFAKGAIERELDEIGMRYEQAATDLDEESRAAFEDFLSDQYHEAKVEFPRVQWAAEFMAVYATFEDCLNRICRIVQQRSDHNLSFKEIRGSGIERAKIYLSRLAGVKTPFKGRNWTRAVFLAKLRNAIAHTNGEILSEPNKRDSLFYLLSSESGVTLHSWLKDSKEVEIILSPEFVMQSLQDLKALVMELCDYELYGNQS